MRLIDADLFIERVMDGTYIYLQANKEDVVNAINSEATVKEDQDLIKHMNAIKAYCKACPGCINCPMFDNCAADNIRRFPRYWYIPEVT